MTELQRYLAEETAEDHADGIITRREAVRRLGLLGLSASAATSLLASFSASSAVAAAPRAAAARSAADEEWAPAAVEAITFAGPEGRTLMGAWAAAAAPRGGVLVIHENRGLTDHIRTVAARFAGSGYSALAIDLLSEEGGTGAFTDPAQVPATLGGVPPERFVADMKAGLSELERRLPGQKLAATGFCFGGSMTWRLLASAEPRLAAAAPFYGPFPEGGSLAGTQAAVLGVYGGLDARVNASRDAATAALVAAGLEHTILTFSRADHAFYNDTGPRFDAGAAAEAHRRVLAWFDEHVGS